MSFLSDLKAQIISQPYKSACCRRALIDGVIFAKGRVVNGEIRVSLESLACVEYVSELIKEFFGVYPTVSSDEKGGRRRILAYKSPASERYLNSLSAPNTALYKSKCAVCTSAFLSGLFLASGRATDPKKQYRIEFAPYSNHDRLLEFFSGMGLAFSKVKRRGEVILYSSNSGVAEDFFAVAGMNSTAFFLMNFKIENEFKNTANRIRNCETNNIMKTVSASLRWVSAIEALDEANLLSSLPEELEKTARLRLEHKDYSLARLAAEFTPPISKPGLSHRLNKIVELSETLLKKV